MTKLNLTLNPSFKTNTETKVQVPPSVQLWLLRPVYGRSRDGGAMEILRAILRPRPKHCVFLWSRVNISIARPTITRPLYQDQCLLFHWSYSQVVCVAGFVKSIGQLSCWHHLGLVPCIQQQLWMLICMVQKGTRLFLLAASVWLYLFELEENQDGCLMIKVF